MAINSIVADKAQTAYLRHLRILTEQTYGSVEERRLYQEWKDLEAELLDLRADAIGTDVQYLPSTRNEAYEEMRLDRRTHLGY